MATDQDAQSTTSNQWGFLDVLRSPQEAELPEATNLPVTDSESPTAMPVPALLSDSAVSSALEAERARSRERETFLSSLQSRLAQVTTEAARRQHELDSLREEFAKLSRSHDDLVGAMRHAQATIEQYRAREQGQKGVFGFLRRG